MEGEYVITCTVTLFIGNPPDITSEVWTISLMKTTSLQLYDKCFPCFAESSISVVPFDRVVFPNQSPQALRKSRIINRRLARHSVELRPTSAFLKHKIHGYPSSSYPVFVNLIDNATFWVKDQSLPRIITLDFNDDSMIVKDTGPGVPRRDAEAIFELGFTRKPSGRGLGLHIARKVSKKVGYELVLVASTPGSGAEFHIAPLKVT
jgi:hypothetical protein